MGFVGAKIQSELEEAGTKPSKEEQKARAARERVIQKYFGSSQEPQYADPAAFFRN